MTQTIEKTKVSLTPKPESGKVPVTLTVSADLITNYETGAPVSTDQSFRVVQDSQGEPIIVSIGSDKRLYAITRGSTSSTGWQQHEITPIIQDGKPGEIVAFEVFQKDAGTIVFACSVSTSSSSATVMYVSQPVSSNRALVQWDNFAEYWQSRPFQVSGAQMTKIYMGEVYQSDLPLAMVAVEQGGQAKYYRLNTDLKDPAWVWRENTIPENATRILQLALGQQRGYTGVYALYDTADGRSLQFTSFPVEKFAGKTFSVSFQQPFDSRINCFDVLPTDSKSDNVYAAGEGVYLFQKGAARPSVTIAGKNEISTVHSLLARQDSQNVSLWLINGDGKLGMTVSPITGQMNWQPVLQIRSSVRQIAALRNRYYRSSQLFVVSADNRLIYLWQDPNTTQWQESGIPLEDTGRTLSFNCYTTHLAFRDQASGSPVTNIELKLASSAWTYLKVNSTAHVLSGSGREPIIIQPDVAGNITLINRVSNLSTPLFVMSADWFSEAIDIDPATKVRNTLAKIQSGDDLRGVTLPGKKGEKNLNLIPDSMSKSNVDNAALAIKQFTDLANKLPQNGVSFASLSEADESSSLATFTALPREQNSQCRNLLSVSDLDPDYIWGMSFEDDDICYHEGEAARTEIVERYLQPAAVSPEDFGSTPVTMMALSIGDIGNAIESIAGDVLKALESGLEKVGGFIVHIVEDVAEFVVDIGGKLVKFAVDTVETAIQAINWVFQKIEVFFEDLVKWLGFLFDWDDIIRTKKVIVNVINQSLELAKHKTSEAETTVNNFFKELEQAIDKIGTGTNQVAAMNMHSEGQNLSSQHPGANDFLNSAPGNFANYHLMHSGATSQQPTISASGNKDPLTTFFTAVVAPLGDQLVMMVRTLAEDIYQLFTSNGLTVEAGLAKLGKDVLKQVLNLVRTAVSGFLEVVESALSLIKDTLNATADIPVLSPLYKAISGGDNISLLDVVALILAIPATMLYKVISGDSPFPEGSTVGLDTMGYQELFSTLSHSSPQFASLSSTSGDLAATPVFLSAEGTSTADEIYLGVGAVLFLVADSIALLLRPIESETDDSLPLLPYLGLALLAIKFGSTFPVGDQGQTSTLSYIGWGIGGTALIGGLIKALAGKGNPMVGQAVAVWDLFLAIVGIILAGSTFGIKMTEGLAASAIVLEVASLSEDLVRSVGDILDSSATLNPDKVASGLGLAGAALVLGCFALSVRGGRTAAQLIEA